MLENKVQVAKNGRFLFFYLFFLIESEFWPSDFLSSPIQVSAEFHRITTLNLEPKFMSSLDLYSSKLLSLFQAKKGAAGQRHRAQLNLLLQVRKIAFSNHKNVPTQH